MNPVDQFRDALKCRGIIAPTEVIANGTIQRCDAAGKPGRKGGAYLLHLDGVAAGGFENHHDGKGWETWRADIGRKLAPVEELVIRERWEAQRNAREAETMRRQAETAARAHAIWEASSRTIGNHAYLERKRILPHGVRLCLTDMNIGNMQCNGALVIPMRDAGGELRHLQFIAPDGTKRYLNGPKPAGLYFSIGKPAGVVCIAEGYATAATIHEAMGHGVAVAFDCGSLESVARALRDKMADAKLIVCADDDANTAGNPGVTKARAAAVAANGLMAVPNFGDSRPEATTDFNDLAIYRGAEAVRRCIDAAVTPSIQALLGGNLCTNSRAITRRMADIKAEPIRWLWPYRIARGKVTVIAGHPGLGKSQITASLAGIVSQGGVWPDGSKCERGSVLMVSGEDDPADTIRPRLEAAGADLERVHILDAIEEIDERGGVVLRSFNLKADLARLEGKLEQIGDVRLLSIDPITAYLGDTDSHKNADVRALLAPLADLAARFGTAILGVSHLSKAGGQKALLRVSGSLAFVAAARAAYLVAEDEENEGRRLLLPMKNNIGPDKTGFSFRIESESLAAGIQTSRVVWDSQPVTVTADQILGNEGESGEERSALEEARDFLSEALAGGPLESRQLQRDADGAGIAPATLRRAATSLRIVKKPGAFQKGWRWSLPPELLIDPQSCSDICVSNSETNEQLWTPPTPSNGTGTPPETEVF